MKIKIVIPMTVEIPSDKVPELVQNFYLRHFNEELSIEEAKTTHIDKVDLVTEAIDAGILTNVPENWEIA